MALHGCICSRTSNFLVEDMGAYGQVDLTFTSEEYDSNSYHSVTEQQHLFTAPVDGYYQVYAHAQVQSESSIFWTLRLFGSQNHYSEWPREYPTFTVNSNRDPYDSTVFVAQTIWMLAGDNIFAFVSYRSNDHPNHPSGNLYVHSCRFSIRKVDASHCHTICKVKRTSDLEIPVNTPTTINWQSELIDTASMYSSGNPDRITIPATGYYQIGVQARVLYSPGQWPEFCTITIKKNGSAFEYIHGCEKFKNLIMEVHLNQNDYLTLEIEQDQTYQTNSIYLDAVADRTVMWVRRIDE